MLLSPRLPRSGELPVRSGCSRMMLPGSRLLLRALLLLGAAHCAPDRLWSSPGGPSPRDRSITPPGPDPARRGTPPDPGGTGTPIPPEPGGTLLSAPSDVRDPGGRAERSGTRRKIHYNIPGSQILPQLPSDPTRTDNNPHPEINTLQPTWTLTDPSQTTKNPEANSSQPNQTDQPPDPNQQQEPNQTHQPPEPKQTDPTSQPNQNDQPSQPNQTDPPSQPNQTDPPSQPNQTDQPPEPNQTDPPSQPNHTNQPLEPNQTNQPSEPNRPETDRPTEPNQTNQSSEPNRTLTNPPSEPKQTNPPSQPNQTDPPSELNRTKTDSPPEPNRTDTNPPSQRNRSETGQPSEPNRTKANLSLEPNRTETDAPSEPNRTETDAPPEPNRTETDAPPEPNRTETDAPPEPNRTDTDAPPEPNRTETDAPPEPNRTETDTPPEPNRTETDPPSQPNRTETDPPSQPNRTETDPPSQPNRTETDPPSQPNRTETDPPSEPNRTETDPPSEPNRTETNPPSEPNRTETNPPSEPNRTETNPPSEPNETETIPSFHSDMEKTQTIAESGHVGRKMGPHIYFESESGWTEVDVTQTGSQMSSETGITQKSATRRHVNKRTPHMDTTYISTTFTRGGDRTLLSVTNESSLSDITEIPIAYTTALDSGSTNTGSHKTGSTAKDSGNTTQDSSTIAQDSGNSTEDSGIRNTASDSGLSTYPLQTPSYLVTTYPSPTTLHMSDSTVPFTSVPVTAPNTTSNVKETDTPDNNSSVTLSQSSHSSSSSNSSLSNVESSFPTLPFTASSSESFSFSPGDVSTRSNQSSPEVYSSSPIPSTSVFSPHSSISPSVSERSPKLVSTKSSNPLTTLPTTPALPSLSSSPSVPPSFHTSSSSAESTEISTTHISSVSPSQTDDPYRAYNSSGTDFETSHTATEPETRLFDGTTPTVKVLITTLKSVVETQMTITSTEDEGTQTVIAVTRLIETPAQPTSDVPSTTSANNALIPSPHYSTQRTPHDSEKTTRSGRPTLTTGDPDRQVMTERTTRMDLETMTPGLDTTFSTKGKKLPAYTDSPPDVVTVKYAATTVPIPPIATFPSSTPTAAASFCSPNPCHNGGLCVEGGNVKGYRCDCPAAWHGDRCDRDVDECLGDPCPAQSTCVNSQGSFSCRCPLGYILEKGAGCVPVRTFLGHIEIPRSFLNSTNGKYNRLHQIEGEIVHILNSSFSTISGYYQSTVTNSSYSNRIVLTVQNIFSMASNVSLFDLKQSIQRYIKVCESAPERSLACRLVLHPQLYYLAVSLCNVKHPGCDNETAECTDPNGVAFCQCKPGYFKYSKTDHSCRACDDGYKLESGACVRCPFGLGGFNCSNPYQLITVIIAAGGGGLLLILVVALTVTCCRKSKHDISKLIFKSGDFQMSPYAEYPKTQRSSEWGRETIEMQENGSTKNLLQMTDIYYSPGLRNSETERNGLHPYTGVPGSRHSCIYPGQYNPSFINEENRRRDYF